jgi:hypothetical protein
MGNESGDQQIAPIEGIILKLYLLLSILGFIEVFSACCTGFSHECLIMFR